MTVDQFTRRLRIFIHGSCFFDENGCEGGWMGDTEELGLAKSWSILNSARPGPHKKHAQRHVMKSRLFLEVVDKLR